MPLFLIFSCTKKKIAGDEGLLGKEYYPTTQGKFIVYDVDSTVYTELPKDTITYKYRIKEKIAGSFTDNQGKEALRLERYIKKYNPKLSYDSIPWSIKEVWMVNADDKSVQVMESNIRFTKLIFPIQEKTAWNGNANNTLGEWQYSYDYVDRAETINTIPFSNVLLIKQRFSSIAISYQNYFEKYVKGIGLVQREITDVRSNKVVVGVPVLSRIEAGISYKQIYVSSGHE